MSSFAVVLISFIIAVVIIKLPKWFESGAIVYYAFAIGYPLIKIIVGLIIILSFLKVIFGIIF